MTPPYEIADRNPNEEFTKNGILTEIQYPTGGTTTFTWELNDYSFIQKYQIPPYNKYITDSLNYTLNGTTRERITSYSQVKDKICALTVTDSLKVTIDLANYINRLILGGSGFSEWNEFYLSHSESSKDDLLLPLVEIADNSGKIIDRWFIDKENCLRNPVKTVTLTAKGQYRISLKNPINFIGLDLNVINGYFGSGAENNGENGYIKIKTKRTYLSGTDYKRKYGGLRIAKISSIPNEGSPIVKEFSYSKNNISTGVIMEEPSYTSTQFYAKIWMDFPSSGFYSRGIDLLECYSNGIYSTPLGGGSVEYKEVQESYSSDNLKIKYLYDSYDDYPDKISSPMYGLVPGGYRINTSLSHFRGNLKQKVYLLNDKTKKIMNYNYRILENEYTPTFMGELKRITNILGLNLRDANYPNSKRDSDYAVSLYNLIPYNKSVSDEILQEIYENDILEDSVSYSYFNSIYEIGHQYSFKKSALHKKSDGNSEETYYTYNSYTRSDGALIPINMIETEVTICNDMIVSAKKQEYDKNGRLKAIYKIRKGNIVKKEYNIGKSFYASQALKEIINVPEYLYKYDSNGNLAEISYNGVVLVSYLWGYKGSHPIAEIKGVAYDQVCSLLPENLKPEKLYDNYSVSTKDLSTIRGLFPDKEVTTMTYHWLIGVSAATDSRGVTTHFTYDDFGRLSGVKDFNEYFIRKYDYHYKTN